MPSQVTNYKCPSCTGPLQFDSRSGQMACEYCGSVFTVQEIEALYEEKNEQAEQAFNEAQPDFAAAGGDVQDGMDVDWDLSAAGSDWGAEAKKTAAPKTIDGDLSDWDFADPGKRSRRASIGARRRRRG